MRIPVHLGHDQSNVATVRGHRVSTDQSERDGGGDSAPTPFELFLASIATCAGFYAQRFCRSRDLDPESLDLALVAERNPETRRLDRVSLELVLPPDFPEKYRKALVRAMDQCTVKRAILDPPAIEIDLRDGDRELSGAS